MTKYYTMKECFDACGDDDVPFIDVKWNHRDCRTKSEIIRNDFRPSIDNSLSDQWQIKRAELKVMSAEEILDEMDYPCSLEDGLNYGDECIKNGQLREWLRPEQVELREAVKRVSEWADFGAIRKMIEALKNLKPPYSEG